MRVLKEGKVNTMPGPWWTFYVHTCGYCGAEWLLEESDAADISVNTDRSPNGDSVCVSNCPTCHAMTHTSRRRASGRVPA